ncbi:MAG: STT3 domain-containing protein [Desulfurivibrionaceae bacterium]
MTKKDKKKRAPLDSPASSSSGGESPRIAEPGSFFNRIYPYRRWLEVFGIIIVIAIGLFVRLEDLSDWKAHPERALYQNEALLTTFDGYYYISLSRDLLEGTYDKIDEKRATPEGVERPSPPPLLSVIAAGVAKITPFSLNWIGAVLPVFLGILLFLPLYGLGRYYGGPAMALTAALMGLLSHYYVYRSSLGWFDTDCMNTTWAMAAAWCALHFGVNETRRRYWYFAGGVLVFCLFYWWWNMTPAVVIASCLLPFLVALIFFYRPPKKEGIIFGGIIAAALVALLFWQGFDLPVKIAKEISSKYSYISKEVKGDFPNIGVTISEQSKPTLKEIVARSTGNLPVLFLSGIGFILLCWRKHKESLFLGVPLALGALSFFFAKRFLIFLAPVSALGLGFLIYQLWDWRRHFRPLTAIAPALVLIMAWPAFSTDMNKDYWPKEKPPIIHGMVEAREKTPEDSVIWAWWDHGYPLVYWSRRATINDGSVHNAERSVYNGFPMSTSSLRLSANFIQFYVNQGRIGIRDFYKAVGDDPRKGYKLIKNILGKGPERAREILTDLELQPIKGRKSVEDWLKFFYPPEPRPAYLFLDWRLVRTAYWWYWLGSWDMDKQDGHHPQIQYYRGLQTDKKIIYGSGIQINPTTGVLQFNPRKRLNLDTLTVHAPDKAPWVKQYETGGQKIPYNLYFDYYLRTRLGILHEEKLADSVFGKLFLRQMQPEKYFKPISLGFPAFQIWEVEADSLTKSTGN